jgi:branched-chain amino acid transport system ATP-binding protein
MLRVDRVTVELGGFTILREVSLEVPDGSVVGLFGRNGAGKTTTLRSIMGLVRIASGSLVLDGTDLTHLRTHQRASAGLGYMPEYRGLVSALTVEENLLLPAWAMNHSDARARLATVYAVIPEVQQLARRRATALSGGQQKLVALARGFVAGRKLLLLDEPFEGIAPALAQRLVNGVRELRDAAGASFSVLVAESEFKWAQLLVDRMFTIERGEISPGAVELDSTALTPPAR